MDGVLALAPAMDYGGRIKGGCSCASLAFLHLFPFLV
jgi:hypothetical protein